MSRTIALTRGKYATVDDGDYEMLSQNKWQVQHMRGGYCAVRAVKGARLCMTNAILGLPGGIIVDHRNGETLDNTRSNLRSATQAQNLWNQKKRRLNRLGKPCSSQYKGVYWVKKDKRWLATIRINGRTTRLGYHRDEAAAARTYDSWARKCFGEFARCNFPEEQPAC